MYVQRKDIKKILEVMDEFPDAKSYKLEYDNSSGIGSTISLSMEMELKNRNAIVTVEISGVEDW